VIFSLKYGGRGDIGETLGEILYDYMISMYEPDELAGMYDAVIPVPTHRDKVKQRGFNHAGLMGRSFAKKAGLHYDSGAVIRIRKTFPMKGLGPEERAANIRGAFEIRSSRLPLIEGSNILIIDDIFTTGATVDEIALLLKNNGAERVDFLAFAAAGDMVI
jgi:ComF family protein